MNASSCVERLCASSPKLALRFLMGPIKLTPKKSCRYGGRWELVNSGLREFSASLFYCPNACPCSLSAPGVVRIARPPTPGRSYAGENGWEWRRTPGIEILTKPGTDTLHG